jgi:hypothetical protein
MAEWILRIQRILQTLIEEPLVLSKDGEVLDQSLWRAQVSLAWIGNARVSVGSVQHVGAVLGRAV